MLYYIAIIYIMYAYNNLMIIIVCSFGAGASPFRAHGLVIFCQAVVMICNSGIDTSGRAGDDLKFDG